MVIVFGSQKGGTGKSTGATNLAVALAHEGRDVLLLDADPQGTASSWHARRSESAASRPAVHCVQRTGQNLIAPIKDLKARYEVIVVDTAGHDSVEFRSAVLMADRVIVPSRPSQADIETLVHVDKVVSDAKAMRTDEGPVAKVLLSIVSTHFMGKEHVDAAEFVSANTVMGVMGSKMSDRKVYRDAMLEGLGAVEMDNPSAKVEVHGLLEEVLA